MRSADWSVVAYCYVDRPAAPASGFDRFADHLSDRKRCFVPTVMDPEAIRVPEQTSGKSFAALLVPHLPDLRSFVRRRVGDLIRSRESSLDLVQSVCREMLENRSRFRFTECSRRDPVASHRA